MTRLFIRLLVTALVFTGVYPTFAKANEISNKSELIVSDVLRTNCTDLTLVECSQNSELKVFKAKRGGFAIISASDNSLLAYSQEGEFNPENLAPALNALMSHYQKKGSVKIRRAKYNPKLLSTALFNQQAPYNSELKDNSPVGCTATALSIIMKYHQWPDAGIGTKEYSYQDDSGNIITHAYDYSKPFDWSNILDKYEENGNYTDAQLNAIASLSYASAIAAETIFGDTNSVGYMDDVVSTVWNNLYYDVASRNFFQVYSKHEDWESSIREQIDEGLPILYGGGAHVFVVDGYDENGLFHINWGWGGAGNGYFDLDMLTPYPGENYSQLACAIMWLRPRRDKKMPRVTMEAYGASLFSDSIISNCEKVVKNEPVHLSNFNIQCYDAPGDLTLGVALYDKDSKVREIVESGVVNKNTIESMPDGFQGSLNPTFSIDAKEGDYLSIVYKFDDMKDWEPVTTRAHIANRCPAYGYEVRRISVSWTNEDKFDIRLLWNSNHDYLAVNDSWGAIITPRDKNCAFNLKVNGETSPRGVNIDRNDDNIMISINSTTHFKADKLNIELISVPATEIIGTPITISDLEAGTLKSRISEIAEPHLIGNLVIKGSMNALDFDFIRNEMLSLSYLDISGVSVMSDGVIIDEILPDHAFEGIWILKSIQLPPDINAIGVNAFLKTGIKEISIPSSATYFGGQVFLGCNNLKKVTIAQNTPPYSYGDNFSESVSDATLIVPVGAKEAYLSHYDWNRFGTIIEDENVVDSVNDLYAEPEVYYTIENGYLKCSEKCRVYDCTGRFIGEGVDIALPDRGVFLIVCNKAVKKLAF